MAKDSSFDVVSEVDGQDMDNAVNQTMKEVQQRYDFKGSKAQVEFEKDALKLTAEDEYKLEAMLDILRSRMVKCKVSLKCLDPGKIEPAAGGTVRQHVAIKSGISKDQGRAIVNAVKTLKLKVQAQIMEDQVRVSGAKKDDLQKVMQELRIHDFGIDIQFINLR